MKKLQLKQLIREVVEEISVTPKFSGEGFTTKKELMEMAKSMHETMEYHKKFIIENPVIIAEPSIITENNDDGRSILDEFYKTTLKIIYETLPQSIKSTYHIYTLIQQDPLSQTYRNDFIKNVTYIGTLIDGIEPVLDKCNKQLKEFKRQQDELLELKRSLYKTT
jgi:hypothetical protein